MNSVAWKTVSERKLYLINENLLAKKKENHGAISIWDLPEVAKESYELSVQGPAINPE